MAYAETAARRVTVLENSSCKKGLKEQSQRDREVATGYLTVSSCYTEEGFLDLVPEGRMET